MRKVITILFLMLYAFSVSGITVSSHFCGEKLRAIHILKNGADYHAKQCCKTDKMDGGCCEDKYAKLDVKKHFSSADTIVDLQAPVTTFLQPVLCILFKVQSPKETVLAACNAPPAASPRLYLAHRVFLI